jgi:hypothetical protein
VDKFQFIQSGAFSRKSKGISMRQALGIFLLSALFLVVLLGCADKKKMYPAKEKTPGGKPKMKHQIEPTDRGNLAIILTDKILYPGSTPFEDAQYDYIAQETPARVAHWFEVNLENSTLKNIPGRSEQDEYWIVEQEDLIIEIYYGPNEGSSLIRYKKDINMTDSDNSSEFEQNH